MALLGGKEKKDDTKLPKGLEERIQRGRERLEDIAPIRDQAWEFYRGNHYSYVDDRNVLRALPTVTSARGRGKPRWKARQTRNLILDVVMRDVSATTQRVPSYQVVPSTSDAEDVSAAKLSEKVAVYGHDRWGVRRATEQAVIHAEVGGEAFAWPFFDNTIGPFIEEEGVGEGDVRIRIYGANECYWEPGMRFEESPWHVVEQARSLEAVEKMPGFMLKPGKLTPDADNRQLSHRGRSNHSGQSGTKERLTLVSDYLERPSPHNPEGRWVTMANGRRIIPDRPYPGDGQEPILRKLSYAPDPDSDRDMGLVQHLIDAQRTRNDAENKLIEWKNLALQPQWAAHPGVLKKQRRTDEPGRIYEIPHPGENLKVLDPPTIPKELFEMVDRATDDISRMSAQRDVPSRVEAGKAIEALLENDESRRANFIGQLAEWYSQIMRDCLVLVQRHYTEPRLLNLRGDFGWESLKDFRGAQLRSQVDVKVFAESIEPQTKEAIERRVMNYAQMGWIGAEDAMTALETGTTERVLRSLAQDEARISRVIQRIKEGPDSLFAMPNLPTGRMGPPTMENPAGEPEVVPGWMPRTTDNLAVWRVTLGDWMKTEEFERLDPEMQLATAQIYAGVQELEAQQQQQMAEAQAMQAAQLGEQNAAKPQLNGGGAPKDSPSLPGSGNDPNAGPDGSPSGPDGQSITS